MNRMLGQHFIVFLAKPSCSTSKYGRNVFAASAQKSWNFFRKMFSNSNLCQLSYSQLKLLIKKHFQFLQSGM